MPRSPVEAAERHRDPKAGGTCPGHHRFCGLRDASARGAAGLIMLGRSAHTPTPAACALGAPAMVAFLSQFGPVWACLDQLRALSIESLARGDSAFNQSSWAWAHPRGMKIGYDARARGSGNAEPLGTGESVISLRAGAFGTPHCCVRARRAESCRGRLLRATATFAEEAA